jgi:hypothetical protein
VHQQTVRGHSDQVGHNPIGGDVNGAVDGQHRRDQRDGEEGRTPIDTYREHRRDHDSDPEESPARKVEHVPREGGERVAKVVQFLRNRRQHADKVFLVTGRNA